jgi:hypothetical protein
MRGRLNLFQAAMLRWRSLYPYNAVHAARVDAPLDVARLAQAIAAVRAERGVGDVALDRARGRYEYRADAPHSDLETIAGGTDPAETLRAAMERGLNARFADDGPFDPFRFFAVDAGSSFHVGLAYDHVVAGGDSVCALLADIVRRYAGDGTALARLERHPPTCAPMLLRHLRFLLAGIPALPGIVGSLRRALRPRFPRGDDPYNAFALLPIDAAGMAALARASKGWGVTRNDVLIAMFMQALARLAGDDRLRERRRREIGVASIVNLRREFGNRVTDTFGQFLSSFLYTQLAPPGSPLESIARDVGRATARVRRRKLYLLVLLGVGGAGLLWPWMTPAQRRTVVNKHYPAWAGITPLDADALWRETGASPPVGYVRAVSTGPTAPLIVAPTTAAGGLAIGLTYRTAAYTPDEIAKIAGFVTTSIHDLPR